MRRIAAVVAMAILLGACGIAVAQDRAEEPLWRMVVLPDTQHYSEDYPEHLMTQTTWLRQEAQAGRLDLVLQVGDVVDEDERVQWENASAAFTALDGVVPYVLAAGNHDFAYDGSRDSLMSEYFGKDRAIWADTFAENHSENGFALVDLSDETWLILTLEVFPRDEVIAWAKDVLMAHPDMPTMIVTHAYLKPDGTRYGEPDTPDYPYGADDLPKTTGIGPGAANDAETMFQELVLPFSQVRYVHSGHVLGDGVAHRTEVRHDGSVVHQVVQNYQMRDEGGEGYLRIYEAYEGRVEVSTYSPVLDKWIRAEGHEFVLNTP